MKNPNAVALGRKGGSVRSEAKTKAARENAKKPRKRANEIQIVIKSNIPNAEPKQVLTVAPGTEVEITFDDVTGEMRVEPVTNLSPPPGQ